MVPNFVPFLQFSDVGWSEIDLTPHFSQLKTCMVAGFHAVTRGCAMVWMPCVQRSYERLSLLDQVFDLSFPPSLWSRTECYIMFAIALRLHPPLYRILGYIDSLFVACGVRKWYFPRRKAECHPWCYLVLYSNSLDSSYARGKSDD